MTATAHRRAPLTADPPPPPPPAPPGDGADRDRRFEEGVRTLRVGRASLRLEERLLMVLGGVLAPLGLIVVLLGWWGAARTPFVFEQVPYLISGGLLGVGLVFLGAFLYFAHWLTELVKEQRAQSAAVLDALQRLREEIAAAGPATGRRAPVATGQGSAAPLVATARGTMAHRPGCVVVGGKGDLRSVGAGDGLLACKLCDPYGDEPAAP